MRIDWKKEERRLNFFGGMAAAALVAVYVWLPFKVVLGLVEWGSK